MLNSNLIFKRFKRNTSGVAAVEFAIGAPMMIFAMLIMTDIGLAINERMNLDQSVRAGAEFVMNDISDTSDLEKLMTSAATGYYSDNPDDWDAQNKTPPTVSAIKRCICPNDNPNVVVSCSAYLCTNDLPPSVYYDLAASKVYEAIFLPDMTVSTKINIQVR